ncbi:MAG: hypothetical protein HRU06_20360 [Oceanospirillaceae bacterium]|nr:hypothetical protein [Oceanospirillaceae bacterium]
MKLPSQLTHIYLLIICLFLSGCSSLTKRTPSGIKDPSDKLVISFAKHLDSPYQEVRAQFTSTQPKQLVYRVISDLALTTQWFQDLQSIETVAFETNNNYVLRSIINSPWPFKDREIITCVTTHFSSAMLSVDIKACPNKTAIDNQFVRVKQAQSQWQIKQLDNALVEVRYTAWINPEGSVPAFIFNQKLATSSQISLIKLQRLIANAKAEDYLY